MKWYYLEGKDIRPATDLLEYYKWFENSPNRKIKRTDLPGGVVESTMFLGLDHRSAYDQPGDPILFETMVFGGEHDQYMQRYTTYDKAVAGHDRIIQMQFEL